MGVLFGSIAFLQASLCLYFMRFLKPHAILDMVATCEAFAFALTTESALAVALPFFAPIALLKAVLGGSKLGA